MQPSLNGALDPAEYRRLADIVQLCERQRSSTSFSTSIITLLIGEGRSASPEMPVTAFADLWRRLRRGIQRQTQVGFGLMNEPKGLPTETWLAAANAAIVKIRRAGANNLVFVPGNGWTGAHSWFSTQLRHAKRRRDARHHRSGNNYVYEVHQYLDSNYSGTHRSVGTKPSA